MAFLSEADIEDLLAESLAKLGYSISHDDQSGPDGSKPERLSNYEVILAKRLADAVARLNPDLPSEAHQDAIRQLQTTIYPDLLAENQRIHTLLIQGVDVEYYGKDGVLRAGKVYLLDLANPANNDCLAIRQFTVIERVDNQTRNRRPDLVLFINGLPLVVFELKAPKVENALLNAYNQLQTYKEQIPSLFRSNALLVISNGTSARLGSLSANFERFMPWRTVDGLDIAPKGSVEIDVLVEGLCEIQRLLELISDFTVFSRGDSATIKIIAGYHQFHAVRHALASTLRAMPKPNQAALPVSAIYERPENYGLPSTDTQLPGDRRIGVIWHTQGSGKSLLMAFYAGKLVKHPQMQNPTLLVLTDRNDLDDQLFTTFAHCQDLIRQTPIQAESRDHLRELLDRSAGGVIFTTIQKFMPSGADIGSYPRLTDRPNVIVIADEAHRSQYGLRANLDAKTGQISYGFAKYLRDALPNASFIGFTGTPIEASDVNTKAIFGNYIDVYDINRAVEDGATVPIYYESRLARIELNESEKPQIDREIEALTEDELTEEQERLKSKWSRVEALVGSDKRLAEVANDVVTHFENRQTALNGKAMVVCMSRRICAKFYQEVIALRPEWHSADPTKGKIKVVMTGTASDPPEWQQHVGTKAQRDLLAKRLRDPDDELQIVIVRDMWLTGFDAPCLHTMYVDKPMQGHGLMQAIARVNRVFGDKNGGLIVDYIGIAQSLKEAVSQYTAADRDQVGIDEDLAVRKMLELYHVVTSMFHGFDYQSGLHGTAKERLQMMARAIEWILHKQHEAAAAASDPEEKKRALRRFQDAVLALTKAFALVSASDEAQRIRDEVGLFQALRVALTESEQNEARGRSNRDRELAVQQLINKAVFSTSIIDILQAAGVSAPDISILSEDFLDEVNRTNTKHLAFEALRRLLEGSIRSRSAMNVVQSKAFSQRLEESVARYHSNAITTTEILQELIKLAKDIRSEYQRGDAEGLSQEEIAFYDALAENQSAVDIMGNDQLKVIAQTLLNQLRSNVSVDWAKRDSARARIRVLVKRILRTYGYPPDLQDKAVQTVLQQAEALSASWV